MKIEETNVGKMESALSARGIKLDKLFAKAEAAGSEAKVDYRRGLDDLRTKYKLAQAKLDECTTAGSEKWEILKTGLEAAWSDVETAFKRLGKSPIKPNAAQPERLDPPAKTA